MVDLNWIAAKLTQLEKQKLTTFQEKRRRIMNNINSITFKMQFAGITADIEISLSDLSKASIAETLDYLHAIGFEKPVYARSGSTEIKEGVRGTVVAINKSAKTTKAGKPMYEIVCDLDDGSKITVLKLIATEFRKGDEITTIKNDAGYQDVSLYFDAGNEPDF